MTEGGYPCDYCGDIYNQVDLVETDDGYWLCDSCYETWLEEQEENEAEMGDD